MPRFIGKVISAKWFFIVIRQDEGYNMKTKSKEDNMAYCNKHERAYPITLGCPQCNMESK